MNHTYGLFSPQYSGLTTQSWLLLSVCTRRSAGWFESQIYRLQRPIVLKRYAPPDPISSICTNSVSQFRRLCKVSRQLGPLLSYILQIDLHPCR